MKKDFSNASDSFKKLNPNFFGMVQFQPEVGQQKAECPLDGKSSGRKTRGVSVARSGPHLRIALVNFRHRILDGDNYIIGQKPLRDAISRWIGIDDADKFIEWTYSQHQTSGHQGTVVIIERIL